MFVLSRSSSAIVDYLDSQLAQLQLFVWILETKKHFVNLPHFVGFFKEKCSQYSKRICIQFTSIKVDWDKTASEIITKCIRCRIKDFRRPSFMSNWVYIYHVCSFSSKKYIRFELYFFLFSSKRSKAQMWFCAESLSRARSLIFTRRELVFRKSLLLLTRQADKKHFSKEKTKINEGEKIRWWHFILESSIFLQGSYYH